MQETQKNKEKNRILIEDLLEINMKNEINGSKYKITNVYKLNTYQIQTYIIKYTHCSQSFLCPVTLIPSNSFGFVSKRIDLYKISLLNCLLSCCLFENVLFFNENIEKQRIFSLIPLFNKAKMKDFKSNKETIHDFMSEFLKNIPKKGEVSRLINDISKEISSQNYVGADGSNTILVKVENISYSSFDFHYKTKEKSIKNCIIYEKDKGKEQFPSNFKTKINKINTFLSNDTVTRLLTWIELIKSRNDLFESLKKQVFFEMKISSAPTENIVEISFSLKLIKLLTLLIVNSSELQSIGSKSIYIIDTIHIIENYMDILVKITFFEKSIEKEYHKNLEKNLNLLEKYLLNKSEPNKDYMNSKLAEYLSIFDSELMVSFDLHLSSVVGVRKEGNCLYNTFGVEFDYKNDLLDEFLGRVTRQERVFDLKQKLDKMKRSMEEEGDCLFEKETYKKYLISDVFIEFEKRNEVKTKFEYEFEKENVEIIFNFEILELFDEKCEDSEKRCFLYLKIFNYVDHALDLIILNVISRVIEKK